MSLQLGISLFFLEDHLGMSLSMRRY